MVGDFPDVEAHRSGRWSVPCRPRYLAAGLIIAIGGVQSGTAAAAAPTDVVLFRQIVEKAHNGGLRSDEMREAVSEMLVDETLSYVDDIARSRRYPDWFAGDNSYIAYEARTLVTTAMRKTEGRPAELYDLAAEVFSGQYAEIAMARAAGVPAPRLPGARGSRWLGEGARVTNPSGPLKLQAALSTVSDDRGTTGHGNGRLDPGETALVTMSFQNTGKTRLYSTSLYIESLSDCLYGGDVIDKERQLKELEPGESDELSLRVYASRHCAGQTARLRVRAHDTHQFPAGVSYSVDLKLSGLTASRLDRVKVDGDDYGHSEPSSRARIGPGRRIELSAGLLVDGSGVSRVTQSFTVPDPMDAVHAPGEASFAYGGGVSRARPTDDVDITVPGVAAMKRGLEPHAVRMGWKTTEDARLFVAVDSSVTSGKPGAAPAPAPVATPAGGAKVDRRKVEEALTNHVTVTPVTRRGAAAAGGSLSLVTVDGFRVSVDDPDALMSALASSTVATTPAAPRTPASPSKGSSQYRLRHYIELPVEWEPEPVPVECSIRVSRRTVVVGDSVLVSGVVSNVPQGAAVVVMDSQAGRLAISEGSEGRFSASVAPQTPGARRVGVAVSMGDDQLCTDVVPYTVRVVEEPDVEVPELLDEPVEQEWPRVASFEPGYHRFAGGNAFQAGFSAGDAWRVTGRMASAEGGDFGFGLGPRLTTASKGEATVEASLQVLVGIDTYVGPFAEAGVVLAAHAAVGPFVQFGVGTGAQEGLYGYGSFGLGFYFPER